MVFLGRSLTRLYFHRAVEQFGASAVVLARAPQSGVVPAWVSFVLLSGWVIALAATAALAFN